MIKNEFRQKIILMIKIEVKINNRLTLSVKLLHRYNMTLMQITFKRTNKSAFFKSNN